MDRVSILVSTFDNYSVCWEPFYHGLKKYWPNYPEKLYFITNYKEPPAGLAIKVGNDRGWANNLLYALDKIDSPYILYSQEDYWITHPVPHQNIKDYLAILDRDLADYIRLYPAPEPEHEFIFDHRLGYLAEHAEYRTSLQMALWRKSVLQDLLISGESPWVFEIKGSQRSQKYRERFLCVSNARNGIRYVFTAVVDGEWSKEAYEYAQNESLDVDFYQLPKRPFVPRYKARIKNFLYSYYRYYQKKMMRLMKRFNMKDVKL